MHAMECLSGFKHTVVWSYIIVWSMWTCIIQMHSNRGGFVVNVVEQCCALCDAWLCWKRLGWRGKESISWSGSAGRWSKTMWYGGGWWRTEQRRCWKQQDKLAWSRPQHVHSSTTGSLFTFCREVGHNIYILAHQVHCLHSAQTADLRLRSLNVHCAWQPV